MEGFARLWERGPWPPRCSVCGEKMKRAGALVFSPPHAGSHRVTKTHLCVLCFDKVQKFMADLCGVLIERRRKKKPSLRRKKRP